MTEEGGGEKGAAKSLLNSPLGVEKQDLYMSVVRVVRVPGGSIGGVLGLALLTKRARCQD